MNKAIKTGVKAGIGVLSGVYGAMKLLPQKKRVVMLSRQSNEPSLDLMLLSDELISRGIKVKMLCDRMGKGAAGMAVYMGPLLRQMYYLATSEVALLDSYCIPACLFKKRKGLTVIQMWHALGAMKKFGKSILDKPEGRSSEIASLMKMHKGYDYIFTSSEKARPSFAEAFGYPPEKLTIMSLPRVDVLMDKEEDKRNAEKIRAAYPSLGSKKVILYAPTLRRVGDDMDTPVRALADALDKEKYDLIVKVHPLTEIDAESISEEGIIIDKKFSTMEMMAVADYVITDYSAITYDAALKGIPLYFYAFDKEEYFANREFYLDYDNDMPGPIFSTAEKVMMEIASGDTEKYRKKAKVFADLYIEKKTNCTSEIADLIEKLLI